MQTPPFAHIGIDIIVASLSGALVCLLTQHHFSWRRQPLFFLVSFIMGIIGADITQEITLHFLPVDSGSGRTIGAFVGSALVVTIMTGILNRIENMITDNRRDTTLKNGEKTPEIL